jgi:OHCU decarboxylase
MSGLERLNTLPEPETEALLLECCGSRTWARRMVRARPFADRESLLDAADRIWLELDGASWLEAFAAHPRIGERKAAAPQGGRSARWSEQEQSGAAAANASVLAELAEGNRAYEERFGHVFLICATGKSAEEMLARLRERLDNDPATELRIAAEEQRRITRLRIDKLLEAGSATGSEREGAPHR